jgi:hypothetical protein
MTDTETYTLKELREMDARDLMLMLYPIDGPHDHWSTVQLADTMAEAARTLVHHALPDRYRSTMPYPSTIDAVVGKLASTTETSRQTMKHLAERLAMFSGDARTRDDEGESVEERIALSRHDLHEAAVAAGAVAATLSAAHRSTSHLSYDAPDDEED